MTNPQNPPASDDAPVLEKAGGATEAAERRPFESPTVEKVGTLKDLTQQFGGTL